MTTMLIWIIMAIVLVVIVAGGFGWALCRRAGNSNQDHTHGARHGSTLTARGGEVTGTDPAAGWSASPLTLGVFGSEYAVR